MQVNGNLEHPGRYGSSAKGHQSANKTATTPTPTPASNPVDTTSLSPEAVAALNNDDKIKGNSAQSPAHQAKAWRDGDSFYSGNLGKLVSTLAQSPGADLTSLFGRGSGTTATEMGEEPAPADAASSNTQTDEDPITDPVVDPTEAPVADAQTAPEEGTTEDEVIADVLDELVADPNAGSTGDEDILDILTSDEESDANVA